MGQHAQVLASHQNQARDLNRLENASGKVAKFNLGSLPEDSSRSYEEMRKGTVVCSSREYCERAAAPRTIFLSRSVKAGRSFHESYHVRAATMLGVLEVVCGGVTMATHLAGLVLDIHIPIHMGIWTSLFFIVSGLLAVSGARTGSKRVVVATLVMSVLSIICAAVLLITSAFLLDTHAWRPREVYAIELGVAAVMVVAASTSALLTCCPLCSSTISSPGVIHSTPSNPTQFFPSSPEQTSGQKKDCTYVQMAPLPLGSWDPPPSYHSIPAPSCQSL